MRRPLAHAVAAALLAAGCTGVFVGPNEALEGTALFEHVWRDVDRHYSLFVLKAVDWDSLHGVYAPQAAEAGTDADLADVVGAMLLELRDLHVNLVVGPRVYRYAGYDTRPWFFDSVVVRTSYVTDNHPAPGGRVHFGHAAPDIGYVRIPNFRGADPGPDLDAALAQLGDVRALIVDVRNNNGGSRENGLQIAGRFADRERIYGFAQFRDGPGHDEFTPREPRRIPPVGARRFERLVAVLTNRRSFSATESFVLAMRVLPTVVVIGDSTGGASGAPLARELPNGWTYRFSLSLEYAPDSTTYESVGLAPDVWVRGSAGELTAGRDAVLDTALAVIRRALPSGMVAVSRSR